MTSKDESWQAVDALLEGTVVGEDAVQDAVLHASKEAGLPEIQVSAAQGKLLMLLARLRGASTILEIGTLGGYSAIWLARSGGRVTTLEADPKHATVARANVERAGLTSLVDVKLGPALDTLPTLAGPFDMVFIDADKPTTSRYFDWAVKLTKPGALIVVDNVVRHGAILDEKADANARAMRTFIEGLATDRRVSATVIQTVGTKGWDGFALAVRI